MYCVIAVLNDTPSAKSPDLEKMCYQKTMEVLKCGWISCFILSVCLDSREKNKCLKIVMQWDLCLILSRCQTTTAFCWMAEGWFEYGTAMIRTFCSCISTNTLPSVGYTTPKHHKVNAGKCENLLSWEDIKKNNQNHHNQSTLLLESLFLKAVQEGLDLLDGLFASLSNDVLPIGLHRV